MRSGEESALATQALGERADVHVDFVVTPEVLCHATTILSVDEGRVSLVDQDAGSVALTDLQDVGHDRNVAVHRVDTFDQDQLLALVALQLTLQVVDLVVPEKAAVGLREDHAVNQAGVCVLIGHNEVARAHESGDDPYVHAVAGREE